MKNKISFKKSIILLPWKELRQYCESHVVITWIGKMRTEERDGDVIAWKHKSGKNDWNERDTATSCFFYPATFFASALNLSFVRFISKLFPITPYFGTNLTPRSTNTSMHLEQNEAAKNFFVLAQMKFPFICHVCMRY